MNTIDSGTIKKSSNDPPSSDYNNYMCKPCQDECKEKFANGWCQECDEYMCSVCFRHHRKSKFCKEHVLLGVKPTSSTHLSQSFDELVKCKQHLNESVKFYCPSHEVCGCADCMILEHKTCDVEYIPGRAASGEENEDYKTMVKGIESYSDQVKSCVSDIRKDEKENEETLGAFVADVEEFREALVNHVNKLAADIRTQSTERKEKYTQKYSKLLKEVECIQAELETMKELLQTNKSKPNTLFVSMVELKKSLKQMSSKILHMTERNTEKTYCFQRNNLLESILVKCDKIGQMKKSSELTEENDELLIGSDSLIDNVVHMPDNVAKVCHLEDLKLRSEHLQLDKDTLKYKGHIGLNGVYIANLQMKPQHFFEVEILNDSSGGSVAVGLVPRDFPKQQFPGWKKHSIGYHSDDGRIFNENNSGVPIAPCGKSDRMGCGVSEINMFGVVVKFTKNGHKIGEIVLQTRKDLFPAVALDTKGQKVRVIFSTNMLEQ